MSIDNRVKFSTITLNFYQDNTVKTLIVSNDNLYDYRPEFFQRLGLSLMAGWSILKEFILGVSTIWPFIIIGIALFFGIKTYLRTKKI